MRKFIPVAAPALIGNEKKYVLDCIKSNWISSNGKYIQNFEESFADFNKVKYALSCSNGTVALHLALMALGISTGDEVILPTFTYVATANAVMYCGAKPIFIDSDSETWNIDPSLIEKFITKNTKAIIVVHIYGHPVDMDVVMNIAQKHHLFVIEDAAEAHGAEYKGQIVGSFGDISIFSFYGNKVITTGEGGMVITNNDLLASKVRQLKGQGMDPSRRYWFPILGYNYRMTNIAAAIGLAQLENINWHISRRREIATRYQENFKDFPEIQLQPEKPYARSIHWLSSITISEIIPISRDQIMKELEILGIETRPFFYPLHLLPIYQNQNIGRDFPVAEKIAARGINLPSSANLTSAEIDFVCSGIIKLLMNVSSK